MFIDGFLGEWGREGFLTLMDVQAYNKQISFLSYIYMDFLYFLASKSYTASSRLAKFVILKWGHGSTKTFYESWFG